MKHFCVVFAILITRILIEAGALHAQIPRTLSYQGALTDNVGKPRPDGNYAFIFRLYEIANGGTALWTDKHRAKQFIFL